MKKESLEGELLEDSHIFMHPERYRILELLAEKPMHISELSRALPEELCLRLRTRHLDRKIQTLGGDEYGRTQMENNDETQARNYR